MDAFKVDLFALKNEGGSASATIDLGRRRPFLAWGSVSMVDPLTDFDRDNAYAFDIFTIDGSLTTGAHRAQAATCSTAPCGASDNGSTSGCAPSTRQTSTPSAWASW